MVKSVGKEPIQDRGNVPNRKKNCFPWCPNISKHPEEGFHSTANGVWGQEAVHSYWTGGR